MSRLPRRIELDSMWIRPSDTRNYLLGNTLEDWLRKYGAAQNFTPEKPTLFNQEDFLTNKGVEFEDGVMRCLRDKFRRTELTQIAHKGNDSRFRVNYDKTMKAIRDRVPIIYQAVVWDEEHYVYGIPDLLVREDYLDKIVATTYIEDPDPTRYVVVDIKWSTLKLRANADTLADSGSIPAYKGQLCLYNWALGRMTGVTPSCAYVLGRKWSRTRRGVKLEGRNCFERLGVIDFTGVDSKYESIVQDAMAWIRELREHGDKWSPTPPTRPELYPNLSTLHSDRWHRTIKQIAHYNNDLTLLWNVGLRHRASAIANGITTWMDPRCTPESLGVSDKKAPVIESIIDINRGNERIQPKIILSNEYDWQNADTLELYVDFETTSDVISDMSRLPFVDDIGMVFLIGCGWRTKDGWRYYQFIVNDLTLVEERRIFRKFNKMVGELKREYRCKRPKLIHWGAAEFSNLSRAKDRHGSEWQHLDEGWFDMNDSIFRQEPVVIKGCFSFGLKDIAKQMYEYGMIPTTWDETNMCDNGMTAVVIIDDCVKKSRVVEKPLHEYDSIQSLIEYNEVDCRVMYDIMWYLREHHTAQCLRN